MTENTFCRTLPQQPKIWDPTRLSLKMACDRKHYLQTGCGYRKNGPTSVHLDWGSADHDCKRLLDNLLLAGQEREMALEEAVAYALRISWNAEKQQPKWGTKIALVRCAEPDMRPDKRMLNKMIKKPMSERCPNARKLTLEDDAYFIDERGHCKNCGSPVVHTYDWVAEHPKKTRRALLQSLVYYCDNPGTLRPYAFTDGTPATEIQFRLPLPIDSPDSCRNLSADWHDDECSICHGSGYEPYELLANLDSLVEWTAYDEEAALFFRERKTTGLNTIDDKTKQGKHYWDGFRMNPQIDTYDLVVNAVFSAQYGQEISGLVEVTRTGTKDIEIGRKAIAVPIERRAEWLHEICEYIKESEQLALEIQKGNSPFSVYKRRTTSCMGAFGRCQFWDICVVGAKERDKILDDHYHYEPWDPILCATLKEDEE